MKVIKKITAMMLSIMMVLGMCSVVGAESAGTGETGSITISNAIAGQTYKIYKILTLDSYKSEPSTAGKDEGFYSYKPAQGWKVFFEEPGKGSEYVDINENGYVTWKPGVNEAKAAELAQEALKYATANVGRTVFDETNDIHEKLATGETGKKVSLTFENLPLGYYLVDSSAGALCSLDTTNPDATIQEKNGVPSVKKEVQEDSKGDQNSAWGNENTADIGQKVNFKTTITAKKGAENYVLHDTMSDGLTFDANSVNVKLKKKNDGSEEPLKAAQYALVKPGTETKGTKCTFEVKFEKALCDTLENDDQLIVTYSATLNENATVGTTGNKNKTWLKYGENTDLETTLGETTTKTYEIPVYKYTNTNGTKNALEGVVFELYKDETCTSANQIKLINKGKDSSSNYDLYRIATSSETGAVTQITTSTEGKFKICGLDEDTYYLKEVTAPKGYNKLSAPVKITIGENGTITVNDKSITGTDVEVENKSGSILPSTGGMGTALFYIFGAILVVGSGVVLITKKRMK